MKLLIIGGTKFFGRALVDAALARGHDVTLFHRGQTNPEIYPEIEHILGNRDGELHHLGSRTWDAVIDTCGYVPRVVKTSADYMADKVDHYTFISSISVYKDTPEPNKDESAEVGTIEDETVEEITGESYGPLKALCEQAAEAAMPGQVLVIRPGLIVGPHDPTNRFTYWPVRIAKGGSVLAPGSPGYPTQFIDVRDLGEWTIRMVEQKATGSYNATGPDYRLTFGKLFQTCIEVSGSDAILVWADDAYLQQKEVGPWMEMPLWIPGMEQIEAFNTIRIQKALNGGMTIRPLSETIQATLDWYATVPADVKWPAGLAPEKEAKLLGALNGA